MENDDNKFLLYNKFLEDKLEYLLHIIESRLDKLHLSNDCDKAESSNPPSSSNDGTPSKTPNPYASRSFLTFKAPYIRDFRNFGPPMNDDSRQIKQLTGTEDVESLIKTKTWTNENKQQLKEAVLDHYARLHLIKLIKQKNQLTEAPLSQNNDDVIQKLRLIDEQTEQVKSRKEPRIFVPENRVDSQIDWFAISARITSHHDAQDCKLMWSNRLHPSISDGDWTKDEDICLINAVTKHGKNNWEKVAQELNSNRLAWQCCARYNREYNFIPMSMDEDDANKIIEVINLCRIGNFVPWNQVMYFVQYHSLHQVKYQWQKYCLEQKSKSPWSHNEDILLIKAIERYGESHWSRVASHISGRTNKGCRERYVMRLKYQRRAIGRWHAREDELLLNLIEKFGPKYSAIAAEFPYRNEHQLRSRHSYLKKQAELKRGRLKHRNIYRNSSYELVGPGVSRLKKPSEHEVDRRLAEIFSTYRDMKKSAKKSLVCRSGQDEDIYQSLIQVLCDTILDRECGTGLLDVIISKAINIKSGIFPPCIATLKGFKAWELQQDYLRQLCASDASSDDDDNDDLDVDDRILKIVVGIFLWPAILARLRAPKINAADFQSNSIIGDRKNLYVVRDVQRRISN